MSFMAPPPLPKTKLGYHRQLSSLAGVHVSPLVLGAMSIGDQWDKYGLGAMDKTSSFKLLDAFYDAGGNFIDTSSNYQDETSEKFIGEWAEERGIRDQLVIATKVRRSSISPSISADCVRIVFDELENGDNSIAQKTSYNGNSAKSLHISIEASLKKLRTSYIDIFYLHWWDFTTSIEEVMNNLHHLVAAGKVLRTSMRETTEKTPFVIYQGSWNVMARSFERDIIPMARSQGMALAPWNVLASGKLRTNAEEDKRRQTGENGRTLGGRSWERSEDEKKMSHALEKVAEEVGAKHITAVAIAYVMQKTPFVFPIIGGRKVEHLLANIEALSVKLTPEHMTYLESIIPFDPGFPTTMIGDGTEYNFLFKSAGHFQVRPQLPALRPVE
ncbi:hypothetical protein PLICRDRAFT_174119 [Plicaturopsis crispa FD-325 SS-3]|nr:hypothetical protein PLICRDRAFT_174119 [Plicaturopsis crispa FD-325 SS-3]